jgi:DNA-binding NtrC family response regulator
MSGYTRILSVGHDHHLLSSRSLDLRRAGFEVIEAYSSSDALRLAQSDAVDLVLVCQSIPKQEQRSLIAGIRGHRRLMPILRVIAQNYALLADPAIPADPSPQLLLDALHKAVMNYSNYRPNLVA